MDPNEQSKKEDLDRVEKCANELNEHFDSVQIFCTRHETNSIGTTNVQLGKGNWFARFGQIRTWLLKQEEGSRVDTRKDMEDGDS